MQEDQVERLEEKECQNFPELIKGDLVIRPTVFNELTLV